MRVGLFYRDIYWRFPASGQFRSAWRRRILSMFYLMDLMWYRGSLSVLFMPSLPMGRHIPMAKKIPWHPLPPGHDLYHGRVAVEGGSSLLNLLYVGGLGELYDLTMLVAALRDFPQISLTICTRAADWEREKDRYAPFMGANTQVVHASGSDLDELYARADIGIFFVRPTEYSEFAVSVKIFEYVGNLLPILSVEGTYIGDLVSQEDLGWAVPFTEEALKEKLNDLLADPSAVDLLREQLSVFAARNTWRARADEVAATLGPNRL
jgi:hypothetical protein